MIQRILHARHFFACLLAAATGMTLYFRMPFPERNLFLEVMALRAHYAFLFLKCSYTLFLYTTPTSDLQSCSPAFTFSPSRQGARFGQEDFHSIQTLGQGQNFLWC